MFSYDRITRSFNGLIDEIALNVFGLNQSLAKKYKNTKESLKSEVSRLSPMLIIQHKTSPAGAGLRYSSVRNGLCCRAQGNGERRTRPVFSRRAVAVRHSQVRHLVNHRTCD